MPELRPYLSVVLAGRNDDYAGGTLRRLKVTIATLLDQLERHRLFSEVVVVDWNPPPDRLPLKEALTLPGAGVFCAMRLIEVSPTDYLALRSPVRLPFLVHFAKNVGIRRARGDFILSTNTDILLSEELVSFLATRTLDPDAFYRVDRYDVRPEALELPTVQERLLYCERNVLRVYGRYGIGMTPIQSDYDTVPLFINASGDFLLLARNRWHLLRGLPEERMFHSVHLDSVFCYLACKAGTRERVLYAPNRIYHFDHDSIWRPRRVFEQPLKWLMRMGWIGQKGAAALTLLRPAQRDPLTRLGIPHLTWEAAQRIIDQIVAGEPIPLSNDDNWGLADQNLADQMLIPIGISA